MLKQELYTYDHKNLRIKKQEYNDFHVKNTYYMYLGNTLVFAETYVDDKPTEALFNINNSVSYTYYYGEDVKEELNYYYKDHRSNRVIKTDANGNIVTGANKFGYSSWGELDNEDATEESWFTCKKQDDSGLYYFNARYYDPEVGRFLQEDVKRGYESWYTYCNNNPIMFKDFDGKDPVPTIGDMLSDPEVFKALILSQIKDVEKSDFGKTENGKLIVKVLYEMHAANKIQMMRYLPYLDGWGKNIAVWIPGKPMGTIVLKSTIFAKMFFAGGAGLLVHEATHELQARRGDTVYSIEDEWEAVMNQHDYWLSVNAFVLDDAGNKVYFAPTKKYNSLEELGKFYNEGRAAGGKPPIPLRDSDAKEEDEARGNGTRGDIEETPPVEEPTKPWYPVLNR